MRRLFARLRAWVGRWFAERRPSRRYRLNFVESDELPAEIDRDALTVAREGDDLWSAGMICPCGCGRRLEMMLLEGVRPRWDLTQGASGPSLHPSVWAKDGCRSHFWLTDGQVRWCRD